MQWKGTFDDVVWWIRDTWRLILEGRAVEVYNYEVARLYRKLQGTPNLHDVRCETRTMPSYNETSRASNTMSQPRHDIHTTTCLVPYNSDPPTTTSILVQILPWVLLIIIILQWLMIKCKFTRRKRGTQRVNDALTLSTTITPPPIHGASGSMSSNPISILDCADFVRKEDVTNLESSVFNKVYSQIMTVVTPVVKTAVDASIGVGQAQSNALISNQWDLAKSSSLQAARLEISQWFPNMVKMATEKVTEYIDEKVIPNFRFKVFVLAHHLVKTSISEFCKSQEKKLARFESYHNAAQEIIRTEARSANHKVDDIRREISDTRVRLAKFNSCAKEVLKIQGAASKVESLLRQIQTVENRISGENEALTVQRRKMEEEKILLETLHAKVIKDTAAFNKSRAECAGEFARLTELRSTISKEVDELNQYRTKVKKMQDQLDAKEKSATEKLGSMTEMVAKMEKMQKDMDDIRSQTIKESEVTKRISLQITKDKMELKGYHDNSNAEAKNAMALYEQLSGDMKTLKTSCETTEKTSKANKESNEHLYSQVDLLMSDTASLKEKVHSLEDLEERVEENRKSNKENYLAQVKKHAALSRRVTELEERAPVSQETQETSVPVDNKSYEDNATAEQSVEVEAVPEKAAVLSPTDLPTTALPVDETTSDLPAKTLSEAPKSSSTPSADAVIALQTQITTPQAQLPTRAQKRQAETVTQATKPTQYPSIRLPTGSAIQAVKDKIAAEQAEEDAAPGDSSSEESSSGDSDSGKSTSRDTISVAGAQNGPSASTSSEINTAPIITQKASSSMPPLQASQTLLHSEQSASTPETAHKPAPIISFVNGRPIRRPVRKAPTTKRSLAQPAYAAGDSDSSIPDDQIVIHSSSQPSSSAPEPIFKCPAPISNVASGIPGLGFGEPSEEPPEEKRVTRLCRDSAAVPVLSQSPTRTKRPTALYEAKFTTSAEINFVDSAAPNAGLFQSQPISFGFQTPTAVKTASPVALSAFRFSAATVPAVSIAAINIPAVTHTSTPPAVQESTTEVDPQHDWLTGPPITSSTNAPAATPGLDISLGEDDDWLSGPSNTLQTSTNSMTHGVTTRTQASAPIIPAYNPIHYDPGSHTSAMQRDDPNFDQDCGFGEVGSGMAWTATENNHTSNSGGANPSNAPANTPFDMSLIGPTHRGAATEEYGPSQPSMIFRPQALQNNMMGTPFRRPFQNNFPNTQNSQFPASSSPTITPSSLISSAIPPLPHFAPEPDEFDFPLNLTYPEPSNPTVDATGEPFAQAINDQVYTNDPINFKSCDDWVVSGGDAGEWYARHFPDEFGI